MTNSRSFIGKVFIGVDWIYKAMYVHFLWIVFTILGLVVFGFMPATTAVFSTIRRWLIGETDFPIFKHFYSTYKTNINSSNLIGLIFITIGLFLYIDLKISEVYIQSIFVHVPLLILCVLFFVASLFLFPVYAHYELKPLHYLKQTIFIAVLHPIHSISLLLWVFCVYIIFLYIPAIFLFLGITLVCFPIMWFCFLSFNKLEEKADF